MFCGLACVISTKLGISKLYVGESISLCLCVFLEYSKMIFLNCGFDKFSLNLKSVTSHFFPFQCEM